MDAQSVESCISDAEADSETSGGNFTSTCRCLCVMDNTTVLCGYEDGRVSCADVNALGCSSGLQTRATVHIGPQRCIFSMCMLKLDLVAVGDSHGYISLVTVSRDGSMAVVHAHRAYTDGCVNMVGALGPGRLFALSEYTSTAKVFDCCDRPTAFCSQVWANCWGRSIVIDACSAWGLAALVYRYTHVNDTAESVGNITVCSPASSPSDEVHTTSYNVEYDSAVRSMCHVDHTLTAVGLTDGTIRVLRRTARPRQVLKEQGVLRGHTCWVVSLCETALRMVASASYDGTARLWNLCNLQCIRVLSCSGDYPWSLRALMSGVLVGIVRGEARVLWRDAHEACNVTKGWEYVDYAALPRQPSTRDRSAYDVARAGRGGASCGGRTASLRHIPTRAVRAVCGYLCVANELQ